MKNQTNIIFYIDVGDQKFISRSSDGLTLYVDFEIDIFSGLELLLDFDTNFNDSLFSNELIELFDPHDNVSFWIVWRDVNSHPLWKNRIRFNVSYRFKKISHEIF